MSSFDWKSIVKSVAPMLGTALGGPLGGIAGAALSKALGGEGKADEAVLAEAVKNATPEQLLAIKNADYAFKIQMEELGYKSAIDLEKIAYEDRNSAREREIKTGDSWTPRVIAGIVVFGFLWSVYYVLSGRVAGLKDPATIGMIGTLIGYISAKADTIIGYYFGSSSSSARKDEILAARK